MICSNTGRHFRGEKTLQRNTFWNFRDVSETADSSELRDSHLLLSFSFKVSLVLLLLRLRFDHPEEETEAVWWSVRGRGIRLLQQGTYTGYTH